MPDQRERWVYTAKLAEQAERYDEMAECMQKVCEICPDLSTEERNLLSVAYKNTVGARRAAWRIGSSVIQKDSAKGNTQQVQYAMEYQAKIVRELDTYCDKVLTVLKEKLINAAPASESKVFYIKMEADYWRYKAEYSEGDARASASKKASDAYTRAYDLAKEDLAVTNPIRLGLALNFSVFLYEVLTSPEHACEMARKAFEGAIAELDSVAEETYKDSTLIMQLLRDNLTLWTSEEGEADA